MMQQMYFLPSVHLMVFLAYFNMRMVQYVDVFPIFRMISPFSIDAEMFPAGFHHQINNSKTSRGFPKEMSIYLLK